MRAVAASLLINPNTVARAYQELEREGVIETTIGRGSFVRDPSNEERHLEAQILESVTRLHDLGWNKEELEKWCVATIRKLKAREE